MKQNNGDSPNKNTGGRAKPQSQAPATTKTKTLMKSAAKPDHEPNIEGVYRPGQKADSPTDETDLIGDHQQVSLLDPREPESQGLVSKTSGKTTFGFAANMMKGNKNGNGEESQRHAEKAARQKKNMLAGDDVDKDIEFNSNSDNTRTRNKRILWTFIALMGTLLVLFLVLTLAAILGPHSNNQHQSTNQPFQSNSYRLFSTKTLYTSALNYLSLVPLNGANSPSVNTPSPTAASLVSIQIDGSQKTTLANNFQTAEANLEQLRGVKEFTRPEFFSRKTLESIHKELTLEEGCHAKQFHFFGRHAARLPSEGELQRLASALETIKKRIDLISSQAVSAVSTNQDEMGTTASHPLNQSEMTVPNSNASSNYDPLIQFSEWKMFAQPNQGNLITEAGALETQQLATRFKRLYPELLNANISIGVTDETRTAQTAINFLKALDIKTASLGICELNDFPVEITSDQEQANKIKNDPCYEGMMRSKSKQALSYHKTCAPRGSTKVIKLNSPEHASWISLSVSQKLKLNSEQDRLSYNETKSLYDLCKYEVAILGGQSIWCSLFSEKEMKFMEYLEDIQDFYDHAYGNSRLATSACILTKEMSEEYLSHYVRKTKIDDKTQLYFTHSQIIQRMIAASIDLETKDTAYDERNIETNLKSATVPRDRLWQTSLLTPFSANIAFILYDCPANQKGEQQNKITDSPKPSPDYTRTFDMGGPPRSYKFVTTLNEQPIKLDNCNDFACDLERVIFYSRLFSEKSCNMAELCAQKSKNAR